MVAVRGTAARAPPSRRNGRRAPTRRRTSCECAFDAGDGGTVYLTDSYRAVSYGGNTYGAGGHLLGFSGLAESSAELRIRELTLSLSGVDQTWVSIVLSKQYIGRRAAASARCSTTRRPSSDGRPGALPRRPMEEPRVDDDPSGKCVVTITSRDQFADFERRNGRHTNANDQNMWFPNDRAFDLFAAARDRQPHLHVGRAERRRRRRLQHASTNALNQARGTPFGVIGGGCASRSSRSPPGIREARSRSSTRTGS
jgi:hypothetical protein